MNTGLNIAVFSFLCSVVMMLHAYHDLPITIVKTYLGASGGFVAYLTGQWLARQVYGRLHRSE